MLERPSASDFPLFHFVVEFDFGDGLEVDDCATPRAGSNVIGQALT
jgi:hypothetical protein